MDDFISLVDERIKKSNTFKSYLKSIPCRVVAIDDEAHVTVETVDLKVKYVVPNFSGASLTIGENVKVAYTTKLSNENAYIIGALTKVAGSSLKSVEIDTNATVISSSLVTIGSVDIICDENTPLHIESTICIEGFETALTTIRYYIDDEPLGFYTEDTVGQGIFRTIHANVGANVLSGSHTIDIKCSGNCAVTRLSGTVWGNNIRLRELPYDPTSSDDYLYQIVDNQVTILQYIGASDSPSIPSTIEGYPVKIINSTAFNFTDVKRVLIPSGIEKVN